MKRVLGVVMIFCLMPGCKKESLFPPQHQPVDISIPTLSYPFTSFASTDNFIAFGDTLPDTVMLNKGYRVQLTDTNAPFVAASAGIVSKVVLLSNGSSAVHVRYRPHSIYTFVYTGVGNVQVQVNDSISPGSVLGKVNSTGVVGFSLSRNEELLCPYTYGAAGFNNGIQLAINRNNTLHPSDPVTSPCLAESLPK